MQDLASEFSKRFSGVIPPDPHSGRGQPPSAPNTQPGLWPVLGPKPWSSSTFQPWLRPCALVKLYVDTIATLLDRQVPVRTVTRRLRSSNASYDIAVLTLLDLSAAFDTPHFFNGCKSLTVFADLLLLGLHRIGISVLSMYVHLQPD